MNDRALLRQAIELSRSAPPSDGAYSVGAIIVDSAGAVIATGYSRERGCESHAEQVAIEKALERGVPVDTATLYSSLEPCSVRLSGSVTCTARIFDAGIPRVVFAMREPPVFVEGHGADVLEAGGVEVVEIAELAPLVAEVNVHIVGKSR